MIGYFAECYLEGDSVIGKIWLCDRGKLSDRSV